MSNEVLRGFLGIVVLLGIAWLASEQRRSFPFRTILFGLAAQVILAVLLTRVPAVTAVFGAIAHLADGLQQASTAGTKFMFGYLGGGQAPYAPTDNPASSFIFAFQALPAFLVVSALSAMLWHWRILIAIVRGAAWLFGRAFGVSGPVGVSVSACIFLGMVEAPLLVRPLLPKLSRGELFIIMVDGLSVVAGSTMILLATLLAPRIPDAFRHLLIASVISTPMAIAMAKSMVPGGAGTADLQVMLTSPYRSTLDALTQGTLGAIRLVANIAGLLIVFVSLIALLDTCLSWLPHAGTPLSLGFLLGKLLLPVTWLMGIPLPDLEQAGALLGIKVVANEVVAYSNLLALPPGTLQSKTEMILTHALCSFGNIGSVAILIGSLSAMAPDKVQDVLDLGFKALLASFLTTCLTGTILGLLSALP